MAQGGEVDPGRSDRAPRAVARVCLGRQLVAEAAGAKPRRASEPEIGWHEVELTPEAAGDPLLGAARAALRGVPVAQLRGAAPARGGRARPQPGLPAGLPARRARPGASSSTPRSRRRTSTTGSSDYRSDADAVRIGLDPEALRAETQAAIGAWNDARARPVALPGSGRSSSRLFGREVGAREAAVDEEASRR